MNIVENIGERIYCVPAFMAVLYLGLHTDSFSSIPKLSRVSFIYRDKLSDLITYGIPLWIIQYAPSKW